MAITDDRTTHLSLAKPSAQNLLEDDVSRLRDALDAIDAAIWGRQTEEQVTASVNAAIAAVVDGAPASLNTLNELATALADDANFASTVTTQLAGKADKVHSHTIADVTGLQAALDAKLSSLPVASASTLGGVKLGAGVAISPDGTISVTVPLATASAAGLVKPGANLAVDAAGALSVTGVYTQDEVNARTFGVPLAVTGTSVAAVSGSAYVLLNASATTVQLPSVAAAGAKIRIYVANGRKDNVVQGNGAPILSQANDVALDLLAPCYTFEKLDATRGWYLQ